MKNLKISVIVPIYKVENYLKRCVDSIINQTYKNLEIILVDDGSPDHSPEICDNYAKIDNRVIVIHKNNGGLSEARNYGLQIASGDYIMYVDSDDYIEINSCEKLIENITDNVDIVVGDYKEIRNDSVTIMKHTNLENGKQYFAKEFVLLSIEKNEWFAPAWLNLYKRKFLIENNLFYKVGYYFEDLEMLPRLFLANPYVKYVSFPFYNYVIRNDSIMTSKVTDIKKNMISDIYSDWYINISKLSDEGYRNKLFGILVRYYISAARRMKITGWKSNGIDFNFSIRYALNRREKVKVIIFQFFPFFYVNVFRYKIK